MKQPNIMLNERFMKRFTNYIRFDRDHGLLGLRSNFKNSVLRTVGTKLSYFQTHILQLSVSCVQLSGVHSVAFGKELIHVVAIDSEGR